MGEADNFIRECLDDEESSIMHLLNTHAPDITMKAGLQLVKYRKDRLRTKLVVMYNLAQAETLAQKSKDTKNEEKS